MLLLQNDLLEVSMTVVLRFIFVGNSSMLDQVMKKMSLEKQNVQNHSNPKLNVQPKKLPKSWSKTGQQLVKNCLKTADNY